MLTCQAHEPLCPYAHIRLASRTLTYIVVCALPMSNCPLLLLVVAIRGVDRHIVFQAHGIQLSPVVKCVCFLKDLHNLYILYICVCLESLRYQNGGLEIPFLAFCFEPLCLHAATSGSLDVIT